MTLKKSMKNCENIMLNEERMNRVDNIKENLNV